MFWATLWWATNLEGKSRISRDEGSNGVSTYHNSNFSICIRERINYKKEIHKWGCMTPRWWRFEPDSHIEDMQCGWHVINNQCFTLDIGMQVTHLWRWWLCHGCVLDEHPMSFNNGFHDWLMDIKLSLLLNKLTPPTLLILPIASTVYTFQMLFRHLLMFPLPLDVGQSESWR